MKVCTLWRGVLLVLVALTLSVFAESLQVDAAAQAQNSAPTGTQTTTLPPQSQQSQGAAPLRVMVGKSLLINTTERLKRISITDDSIAFARVITPTQILVHGKTPGEVSLLIWDELERSRSFDLRVDVDVSACADEERRVFPDEQIAVTPSRAAIVLSGHVSTEDVAKRAAELASAYSPRVVNVLTFGPVGAQEVLLQVKFAEVDRSALNQMGVNFISTGAANTNGTVTTGQFGGVGPQTLTPGTSAGTTTTPSNTISNVLNLFVFRPDINFGAVIEALENKNLLQILAEIPHRRKPVQRLFGQSLLHHLAKGAAGGGIELGGGRRVLMEDCLNDVIGSGAIERLVARERLVTDYAEREKIGGRSGLLGQQLLGGHVVQRALHGSLAVTGGQVGYAEIDQLDRVVFQDEDVAGFDIAVNQSSFVRGVQAPASLGDDVGGSLDR